MSLLDETSGEMYMPRKATGLVKAKNIQEVNIRGKGRQRTLLVALKAAYKNMQPISEQKKADLIKLVKAKQIAKEFAPWYKNLKMLKSLRNRLPEPNYDESERSDSEAETDI